MTLPVVVAVPGADEARLVAAWEPLRRELVVVRRCADVADVLAAAGAGLARAAVLGADLPGCDTETVAALRRWGTGLLVLLPAGVEGEVAERRWRALGATRFAGADRPAAELAREVLQTVRAGVLDRPERPGTAPEPTTTDAGQVTGQVTGQVEAVGAGRTVAVWGPHGSCGRTTVALNLAAEFAQASQSVLLVDADTRGAAVGQALGLLDEAPGVLAAVRSAADGRLDVAALHRHAPILSMGVSVLTGAADPLRWSELRPAAFRRVLEVSAAANDWTVVDLPGGLDDAGEAGAVNGRDAVTATALEAADVVLVVGTADPVGLQRFVRAWSRLPDIAPEALVVPVVSRIRPQAVGAPAARRTTAALRRLAGIEDVVLLPEDGAADSALLAARVLLEAAPRSSLRRAVRDLALRLDALVDAPLITGDGDPESGFDPLLARS